MGISLFSACPSPAFGGQAQLRTASTPFMGIPRRALELCTPGRVGPPTWNWAVPAVLDEDQLVQASRATVVEKLDSLVTADVLEPVDAPGLYNQSGLNGLNVCGTEGLQSGVFQVSAAQPVHYVIQEKENLFDPSCKELLRGVVPGSFPFQLTDEPMPAAGQRRLIVIDDNVERIHGNLIRNYFETNGVEYKLVVLPTQEANKNFDLVYQIADELESFGINRRKEPIIAIGGGVCLDIAGLTANLYRRNTPVIKIPTTLMAAIDASIGIKTAVNFHNKKNKLGTYCPPLAVFIDRTFLQTCDQRNISNGAAEMLKMACIKDEELFKMLESGASSFIAGGFQGPVAGAAMRRSIQGMLEELEYNLWEHILCRLVDYGHTFSPEIEMAALVSGLELLHGEAVNIDMALTTQIAYARGMISLEQRNRVFTVMTNLKLPFWHPVCNADLFYKGLLDTKKARDGLQRVPLMNGVGAAKFVNDVTQQEIVDAAGVLKAIAETNGTVFGATQTVSSVVPKPFKATPKPAVAPVPVAL